MDEAIIPDRAHRNPTEEGDSYRRLFRNRGLMLLWGGETVSVFGDAFFNLAVMWVVYTQSHSALQTALVQVVWQLPDILVGPLAGVLADRWDRKRIMVVTNVLAAAVVGAVAALMTVRGSLSPLVALSAVFFLNGMTAFLKPARGSIMPELVGRDLMATASGLFSTVREAASLLGNALAGVAITVVGAAWAVLLDALSFVFVAACIAAARLPVRTAPPPSSAEMRPSFVRDIHEGWRAISEQPVVRPVVWLGVLINVASFLGPLYPALVDQRLGGGAAAFGMLSAAGVAGAMAGGVVAGTLERRLGAGRVLSAGWGVAGACVLGIAASTSIPLTAALEAGFGFCLTVGAVSSGALAAVLIPENYRGRAFGIMGALSVLAIPISSLIGGWLADILGVVPLYAAGGAYILGVAALAWSNPRVRGARI